MKAKDFFGDEKIIKLSEAAAAGNEQQVQELAALGANVNASGNNGITPLLYVMATTKSIAGINALLRCGADPNYISSDDIGPLLIAAQGDDLDLLRVLLRYGGNPNLRNKNKQPVTFLAALQHRWSNINLLLKSGANINITDASGYTLAMYAASFGDFEIVFHLIQKNADITQSAPGGAILTDIVRSAHLPPTSIQSQWRDKVLAALSSSSKQEH